MGVNKILVPLGRRETNLKSVHYALALSKRLQARVCILQQAHDGNVADTPAGWLDEALLDLIHSARRAGMAVTRHIARRELKDEIVDLIRKEKIDLLILGTADGEPDLLMRQLSPLITSQIIQVGEKQPPIEKPGKKDDLQWHSY